MPNFNYRALSGEGKVLSGSLAAENREAALSLVRGRGLRPLSVENAPGRPVTAGRGGTADFRAGQKSVEIFMRQVANLLNAGVPLSRALEIVVREAAGPEQRRTWQALRDDVIEGISLAEAMSRRPRTFPAVYTSMVRAGETGGFLNLVLEQIADFCARDREIRSRVRTALIYPAILVTAAFLVMAFLMIYFIPQFSDIFREYGAGLPLLTRLVIGASNRLTTWGPPAVALATAAVLAARRLATEENRLAWEKFFLRLPLLGPTALQFALARFCRVLGTLLNAGVPLVSALGVSSGSLGYRSLSGSVARVIDKVRDGSGLARGSGFFPPSMVEIIGVAEESGTLGRELVRLADTAERELDRKLGVMVAVFEPAVLLAMAVMVGVIVIGMLLPIFTLQDFI